eukprot:CAMPEP_0204581444 /NCGR_PEP_ID=MMETSP0661-20131031/44647_1 /ASSEMBLY_ACC=CAM_ASM_000606 /TAXON_ID=109239 /ORGANISM="Alexandrium margalefi, Strain AMGDE01CS-322" /LENGTH=35 /DNA_ID= /DNA_START= /DNA_END= /DNA_ORIENTATION=
MTSLESPNRGRAQAFEATQHLQLVKGGGRSDKPKD